MENLLPGQYKKVCPGPSKMGGEEWAKGEESTAGSYASEQRPSTLF